MLALLLVSYERHRIGMLTYCLYVSFCVLSDDAVRLLAYDELDFSSSDNGYSDTKSVVAVDTVVFPG